MWEQVRSAKDGNKHELLISGKELSRELEASNGSLDLNIFGLTQLNFLRLSGSTLTFLPEEVGNLVHLTCLELQCNAISLLPGSIKKLTKLKILDVSENKLQKLPEAINCLSSLTTLNARKNGIDNLLEFDNCCNLSIIDLRMNKLRSFKELCNNKMTCITELQIANNEIEDIPEEISFLTNLKTVNLAENKIKNVPSEVLVCSKLKDINLKGNPLADRRFRKLVESDRGFSKTVLDYLKQHLKDNKGKSDSGKNKKATNINDDKEVKDLCDRLCVLSSKQNLVVKMNSDVRSIRGYLVCCILYNVDLSGMKLKRFLSIQTKLHETICEKRVAATIATHDLSKICGPLEYCAKSPDNIVIHPLNKSGKISAKEYLKSLQEEAEAIRKQMKRNTYSGIHKYLSLVEGLEKWPCLVDTNGTVISFPPITNAQDTKIENESKNLLLEVTTNVSLKKAKEVMEALIIATVDAELCSEKTENGKKLLSIEQVRVVDEDGNLRIVFPSKTDLVIDTEKHLTVVRS